MNKNTIGFWKSSDRDFGYLSSPIGFKDNKPVRIRLIKNKYANKEKNTPTFVGFIDGDCEIDEHLFEGTKFESDKSDAHFDGDAYYTEFGERLYTESEVRNIINGTVRDVECGITDPYDILPTDFC